jgi:hypothetical protein
MVEAAGSSATAVIILLTTQHSTLQWQFPNFPYGAMIAMPKYILYSLHYLI